MKKKFLISLLLTITILTAIFSTVYATDEQVEIPSSYDLRNDISIRVENQGQRGWCNVYAYTKMVETYLQKVKGINYNLSESYIAYSNAPYFGGDKEELTSATTINNNSVNVADASSKLSFVQEQDFPNQNYEFNEANKNKFDSVPVVVKSIQEKGLMNAEEIKSHIINNGAVHIHAFEGNKSSFQWQHSNGKINCKRIIDNDEKGHAVVIIGWDDNYSRNNFDTNCRPENDGAWLILNSWGADWGNNGTAWVSYEDEWFNYSISTGYAYGVESIKLIGEKPIAKLKYNVQSNSLNANAELENYSKLEAYITVDERVEDIEGWISCNNNTLFKKTFLEVPDIYDIEIISKIDNTSTILQVNIPQEAFEKDYIQIGNNESNIIDIVIIIVIISFIILIMVLVIKIFINRKD